MTQVQLSSGGITATRSTSLSIQSKDFVFVLQPEGFSHIALFAKHSNWWCPEMLTGVLVRDSLLYLCHVNLFCTRKGRLS
jgi:hypothetical protein